MNEDALVCICGRMMGYAAEACDVCDGEPHEHEGDEDVEGDDG